MEDNQTNIKQEIQAYIDFLEDPSSVIGTTKREARPRYVHVDAVIEKLKQIIQQSN